MAKRKSERQIKEEIQHAEYLGLRTNQVWEREEDGKVQDEQHVSASHSRVLCKMENVEGAGLGWSKGGEAVSFTVSVKFCEVSKQRRLKGSPHTSPKTREALGILGSGWSLRPIEQWILEQGHAGKEPEKRQMLPTPAERGRDGKPAVSTGRSHRRSRWLWTFQFWLLSKRADARLQWAEKWMGGSPLGREGKR